MVYISEELNISSRSRELLQTGEMEFIQLSSQTVDLFLLSEDLHSFLFKNAFNFNFV